MKGYDSLILLAMHGKASGIRQALKLGADPNERDASERTPLHWAAQEGWLIIIRCLIEFRAKLNVQDNMGFTPLAIAAGKGNDSIVCELLKAGASAKVKVHSNLSGTALHLACSWNRFEVVKSLLQLSDVEVNAKDQDGKTALAYAIEAGDEKLISCLKEHGGII
ncbi:MAG: ankyrin repeat domain-containing protein [Verrucomicrobiota bacterium]